MTMTIAIPVIGESLSPHFGHCEKFAIYQVQDGQISGGEQHTPPAHEHGQHISFLKSFGCEVLIAGGMGAPAQELCLASGISIYKGLPGLPLRKLVEMFVNNELPSGATQCDHSHHD
ncbi:MAG TPA: NifB/NifX family molybdenum-iron cluster-binding protein [Candidatus Cloacimonadota bacterium]|nr:NifB/NifX family molybdenum-iron cluster-binding protein [Candidatus Cloacimonadota bacterium]HPS39770.1 NifB/NifX family molybdenum-iron cluster-binding protein [Candidatus Cloacimonadota bacterium]